MHDHLHILMEVDDKTRISTLMHDLTSSYTKYFNGRYQRKGHLFRERFKAALIEKNPKLLLNLTTHMHLNPERLKIAIQAKSHSYTSYALYVNYDQADDHGLSIKQEIEKIVNTLIGENYVEFMARMADDDEFKKTHKKLRKGMLGSPEFIQKVKDAIEMQREQAEVIESDQPKLAGKKNFIMGVGTAILLITIASSGVYLYFDYIKKTSPINIKEDIPIGVNQLLDLNNTEWQIKLIGLDGNVDMVDIISFMNGKFSSAYLSGFEYPHINYSSAKEADKLIWETMQTSSTGTASWRGEVENEKMTGILSLRQNGQNPQDFSFKSLKYRRR